MFFLLTSVFRPHWPPPPAKPEPLFLPFPNRGLPDLHVGPGTPVRRLGPAGFGRSVRLVELDLGGLLRVRGAGSTRSASLTSKKKGGCLVASIGQLAPHMRWSTGAPVRTSGAPGRSRRGKGAERARRPNPSLPSNTNTLEVQRLYFDRLK